MFLYLNIILIIIRLIGMNVCRHSHSSHIIYTVAVCCSVLQCVAVCCSVLQCVATRPILYTDYIWIYIPVFEYYFGSYTHLIGIKVCKHSHSFLIRYTDLFEYIFLTFEYHFENAFIWLQWLCGYIHTLSILCTDCIWLHSHKHCIWLHIHKHNPYSWMQFWLLYTFIVSPNAPSTLYLIT